MNPNQAKAFYAKYLGDRVTVRRYSGTGANRPHTDVDDVRARVTGYSPQQLVGTIKQGDRRIILFADDLVAAGFGLPIKTSDFIVVRGVELSVLAPDDSTRRINGELIAIELQCRG